MVQAPVQRPRVAPRPRADTLTRMKVCPTYIPRPPFLVQQCLRGQLQRCKMPCVQRQCIASRAIVSLRTTCWIFALYCAAAAAAPTTYGHPHVASCDALSASVEVHLAGSRLRQARDGSALLLVPVSEDNTREWGHKRDEAVTRVYEALARCAQLPTSLAPSRWPCLYQRYDLDPAAIPALLDVAGESSSGRAMRFSFAKFCTLLHTAARFRALPPPLPPGRGNVIIVAGDSVSRDMALAWRCSAAAGKGRALVEFPAFAMLAYRALEGKLMGEALECAPANVEQCFFSIDNAHAGPIRCCNTLKEALDAAEMKGLRREDVGAVLAGYGAHYHVGADANASETMMRSHMQGIFRTLDEYCQVSYNSRLILSSLCCITISLLLTLPPCWRHSSNCTIQGGRLCLAAMREPTAQHFQTDVGDFVASATEAIRAADDVQRPCRCKKALDGERLKRSAGGRLAAIIREVGEQYVGRVAGALWVEISASLSYLIALTE